jgi:hypothetical protein
MKKWGDHYRLCDQQLGLIPVQKGCIFTYRSLKKQWPHFGISILEFQELVNKVLKN